MTALTIPCLLGLALAIIRPRFYPWMQALAGVTPAGAAVIAGGTAVPTFYFVALAAPVILAMDHLRAGRVRAWRTPGARAGIAFLGWAVVVTVSAPVLFPGLQVWSSAFDSRLLEPGVLAESSLAQVVYLVLSLCVAAVFASNAPLDMRPLVVIAVGVVVLSTWRWLAIDLGVPFPRGVFDNNTTYRFVEGLPGGGSRFRGTLPEPAALGALVIGVAPLLIVAAVQGRGVRRVVLLLVGGAAVWLGFASGAATFVLAALAFTALLLGWFVVRWLSGRPVAVSVVVGGHLLLGVAVVAAGPTVGWVRDVLQDKIDSDSFMERSGLDAAAVDIAVRTWGWGAGLGTHRPSSLAASLVSNVGLPGLFLAVAGLVAVLWSARRVRAALPVALMVLALLTARAVSGPDLNDTSGLLWIGLGLLAGAGRASASLDGTGEPAVRMDTAWAAQGDHEPPGGEVRALRSRPRRSA